MLETPSRLVLLLASITLVVAVGAALWSDYGDASGSPRIMLHLVGVRAVRYTDGLHVRVVMVSDANTPVWVCRVEAWDIETGRIAVFDGRYGAPGEGDYMDLPLLVHPDSEMIFSGFCRVTEGFTGAVLVKVYYDTSPACGVDDVQWVGRLVDVKPAEG